MEEAYKTTVSSSVPIPLVEWIDRQARNHGTNRSTEIYRLLKQRYDDEQGETDGAD